MTTLAQMLVERGPPNESWGPRGAIALALLQARLKGLSLPELLPESVLEWTAGTELKRKAEQFIFTEDAPGVVSDLVAEGAIDGDVIYRTSRVPVEVCWIEWKTIIESEGVVRHVRTGVLLDGSINTQLKEGSEETKRGVCILAMSTKETAVPIFFASVDRDLENIGGRPAVAAHIHWSTPDFDEAPPRML